LECGDAVDLIDQSDESDLCDGEDSPAIALIATIAFIAFTIPKKEEGPWPLKGRANAVSGPSSESNGLPVQTKRRVIIALPAANISKTAWYSGPKEVKLPQGSI
jgi:hypothetical protein